MVVIMSWLTVTGCLGQRWPVFFSIWYILLFHRSWHLTYQLIFNKNNICLSSRNIWLHPGFCLLLVHFDQLLVFTFLVPLYDVRYSVRVKMMLGSSLNRGGVGCGGSWFIIGISMYWLILYWGVLQYFRGAGSVYSAEAHNINLGCTWGSYCFILCSLCCILCYYWSVVLVIVLPHKSAYKEQ